MPGTLGNVTVIGCGLIGGSLVKALRARGAAARLAAIDEASVLGVAAPYLDASAEIGSREVAALVEASDLVVLAVPIGAIMGSLGPVLTTIRKGATVTDTGSVKKPIVVAARSHPNGSSFVGGHPMAGREVGGFEASSAELFERARWFWVEGAADATAIDRVTALAGAVGAVPVRIAADAHDRAMAYVSHVPQLIASAVYAVASKRDVIDQAGPGFRDMTRISGGPASMWRDIFETNRADIGAALGEVLAPLIELRDRLSTGDENAIAGAMALLDEAQTAKAQRHSQMPPKGDPSP
jgi:prephenate dehydrogenase